MITRLPLRLGASPRLLAHNHSILHRALYSSTATATATAPSPQRQTTPPPPRAPASKLLPPAYPPGLVNPPATTRPPPLIIPPPNPNESKIRQLFHTGKAYLTFYKTGLGQILTNRRLLHSPDPPSPPPPENSRAHTLLASRYRHDRNRLGPFGLLLLVCGELTPFVVLLFPRLVPYTCRIPRQVAKLEEQHDAKRRFEVETIGSQHDPRINIFENSEGMERSPHTTEEMMVVAGVPRWLLTVGRWDVRLMPGLVPGWVYDWARHRMLTVMEDDWALRPAGAVEALVEEEVRLAAMERGLLVSGVAVDVLRTRLRAWVDCTRHCTDEDDFGPYFDLLLRGEGALVRRGALPEAAWEV